MGALSSVRGSATRSEDRFDAVRDLLSRGEGVLLLKCGGWAKHVYAARQTKGQWSKIK